MPEIVPVLTLFGLAALRIMPSATRIMTASNNLRYYESAVHEVANELRLVERYIKQIPHDMPPPSARKREVFNLLEFKNIAFRYPASATYSLNHLSLNIDRGRMIALVGRSGSGKTTFADLLLGLLDPDEGTIRVNGREVKSLRDEWQGMSGLVPQEFFLLDDTVRRNVAFGMPDHEIDEQRVWEALRLAQLEERIRRMPDSLNTRIGERGATLSGGERQRLSIARALYYDPDILVLDEATSALDPTTEAELMETLKSVAGNKTVIVIAHRLTTVAHCDQVCLMQAGQIVDSGTFDELAARNPEFRNMVRSDSSADSGPT